MKKDYRIPLNAILPLINSVYDAIFLHDLDGNILEVNDKVLSMYKMNREIALKLSIQDDYSGPNNDINKLPALWRKALNGEPQLFEWEAKRPNDSSLFNVEVYLCSIKLDNQDRILASVRDITLRKNTEKQLQMWGEVLKNSGEAIFITDAESTIYLVNEAFTKITGYTAQDVIGQKPNIFKSGRHDRQFYQNMWAALLDHGYWQGEIWDRRKDGSIYPKWSTISQIQDTEYKTTHYIAMFNDISERKISEERIHYLAFHDVLTGLPNRRLLQDHLQFFLEYAQRSSDKLAVLFIDIDNFKTINDSLGHSAGDKLLIQLSKRLLNCLRTTDTLGRFGGDEFVIILSDIANPSYVATISERIRENLHQPFHINGFDLIITVSIGISLYPADGNDYEHLVKNADTAMNQVKENGRNNYQFYTADLNILISERLSLINSLRNAVNEEEFILYYQPKINSITGKITGVEALIRWNSPNMGLIPPLKFIPLLEETGLIMPVSDWILSEICKQHTTWIAQGLPPISIAINISAVHFQKTDFLANVKTNLAECTIDRNYIEFELTEGILLNDTEETIDKMNQLKKMGIKLTLDDFGTGYSSLSYLRKFPIEKIKIDQSFVQNMMTTQNDMEIVKIITLLSKTLQLGTIAEGVEHKEQFLLLQEMGCDELQGYFFAEPMSGHLFAEWYKTYTLHHSVDII
jgi:diguanylate cyclase (GGDEF)-like protein/PAS domain S-box-containing protein